MKELDEILERIRSARDYYDTMHLEDVKMLSEVLRTLTNHLFYLAEYRIQYHEKWLDVYNNEEGTNAAKEREADSQVRELYQIRHLMTAGNKLVDIIRSQISIYKNENN